MDELNCFRVQVWTRSLDLSRRESHAIADPGSCTFEGVFYVGQQFVDWNRESLRSESRSPQPPGGPLDFMGIWRRPWLQPAWNSAGAGALQVVFRAEAMWGSGA